MREHMVSSYGICMTENSPREVPWGTLVPVTALWFFSPLPRLPQLSQPDPSMLFHVDFPACQFFEYRLYIRMVFLTNVISTQIQSWLLTEAARSSLATRLLK